MKKTVTTALVCFMTICLINSCCGNKTKKKHGYVEMLIADTAMPPSAVHLDTALKNIKHYVDSCKRYFPGNSSDSIVRSYTVSATDLFGVLRLNLKDTMQYDMCRVYLGLDYKSRFKLYFTPAKSNKDIILYYLNNKKDTVKYVYDLNAPCPSTCAVNSPLNVR